MKKLLFVLLAAAMLFGCQKKNEETAPAMQDVSFNATEILPEIGRSIDDWICKDDVPTNAWIAISYATVTTDYYPELFSLNGNLYTQSIKLPVGVDYCIEDFILYKEVNGTPGYQAEDIITHGTPHNDSDYAGYVANPLPYCFEVEAFVKLEIYIEVLCFQDAVYANFGFNWFAITEIVIRQFCFFGDLCITDDTFPLYDGSIYEQGGIDPDEEAVFQIIVKDNGQEVPYSPFSNVNIYNNGEALCVDYPDNLSETNNFTFELQVWQPDVYGVFSWVSYTTFTSTDAGNLFYGTEDLGDNTTVKSFAVGDCSPDSYPIFDFITLLINETFEDYDANDYLVAQAQAMGRNYWVAWSGGSGTPEDPMVSNAQAAAGNNSVVIEGVNDAAGIVFTAYTAGLVNIDLDIYVPTGKNGYFNVMQEFTPPTTFAWGSENFFDPGGICTIQPAPGSFTFTYDAWHHVSMIIDLDTDNAEMFFNGTSVKSWTWSTLGGLNQFQAIDLYANGANAGAYFDNILITITK